MNLVFGTRKDSTARRGRLIRLSLHRRVWDTVQSIQLIENVEVCLSEHVGQLVVVSSTADLVLEIVNF